MGSKISWRKRLFSHSIFVKLVAAMIGLGIVLLVILALFFSYFYEKTLKTPFEMVIHTHSLHIVRELGSPPSLEKARIISEDLRVEIRYEGPDLSWTTSESLMSMSQFEKTLGRSDITHSSFWRQYYVIQNQDGGAFLFKWDFGWASSMHRELLTLLLLLVGIVVTAAYLFIHRTLKPIKDLQKGVQEISAGNLDAVVPQKTTDEIGVLTESFNTMIQRIREMIHARDQLLVDVSHELRSPLTRMRVALEFIPESEKKHKLAQDISEIETKIREILEIERLKNGSAGLDLKLHDLNDLIKEVVRPFVERGRQITQQSRTNRMKVFADANMIKIVLNNVLENAIKYSLPDSRPIEITTEHKENTLVIRIKDDGRGIPEKELPYVFEPFYRVDRSRSKKTGGYGLGLSMCKKIMEAHEGRIDCRNNSGERGATITLILPTDSS